jgi:glycosyltransferase 2 family protein
VLVIIANPAISYTETMSLRSLLKIGLPWLITVIALYLAFRGIDFTNLFEHLKNVDLLYLLIAVALTFLSYLIRAFRWEYFFQSPCLSYYNSALTLFLGFFMNNILPARAGELVRAHVGARLSKQTRTLVLATIASERLCDGLTISFLFLLFAQGIGDQGISHKFVYVASAFVLAGLGIVFVLLLREYIFNWLEKIQNKLGHKLSSYALTRLKIFISGLEPLLMFDKIPFVVVLSLVIWTVELAVYYYITQAFSIPISIPICVLFLVTVNFSSLIPSAPAGIGVIEAVTTAVLVSIGLDREQSLSMVLTQHFIQILVVGIPGALVMLTWRKRIQEIESETNEL